MYVNSRMNHEQFKSQVILLEAAFIVLLLIVIFG